MKTSDQLPQDTAEENLVVEPYSVREIIVFTLAAAMLGGLIWRSVFPPSYAFVVEARSQLLSVELSPRTSGEIKWRTKGLVFCSREDLALPKVEAPAQSICGSRRMTAYQSSYEEQVLQVVASSKALLSSTPDGGMRMQLKAEDKSATVARISWSSGEPEASVKGTLVLIWPGSLSPILRSASHGIYPITGSIVVGKDINWASNRLLLSGELSLFSGDNASVTGRTKVAQNRLMMGDQLTMSPVLISKKPVYPKGFIYFSGDADHFDVKVFGRMAGMQLSRYGEKDFSLLPGLLSRYSGDPFLVWGMSFLMLLITVMNNLKGGANVSAWVIKHWRKNGPAKQSNKKGK